MYLNKTLVSRVIAHCLVHLILQSCYPWSYYHTPSPPDNIVDSIFFSLVGFSIMIPPIL